MFRGHAAGHGRKNHNCIEVNGEKGSVVWDFEEQNYLYFYDRTAPVHLQGFVKINATTDSHPYKGGPWPVGHGIGYGDTFVIEVANFVTAITNRTEFRPDFQDGVAVQTGSGRRGAVRSAERNGFLSDQRRPARTGRTVHRTVF